MWNSTDEDMAFYGWSSLKISNLKMNDESILCYESNGTKRDFYNINENLFCQIDA